MRRENTTGLKSHVCQLPRGEEYSTPANDRKCEHKPGPSVVCDHDGCKHSFGRACLVCDKVV